MWHKILGYSATLLIWDTEAESDLNILQLFCVHFIAFSN